MVGPIYSQDTRNLFFKLCDITVVVVVVVVVVVAVK